MSQVMGEYGYSIEHILMVDIIPDPSVRRAMNEINAGNNTVVLRIYFLPLHVSSSKMHVVLLNLRIYGLGSERLLYIFRCFTTLIFSVIVLHHI